MTYPSASSYLFHPITNGAPCCPFQFTHLVFKRSETHEPLHIALLLFGFPAALTYLYPPSTHSLVSAGATTFSTFWIALTTSIVLYRLSPWHPLAQYPGPVMCKISKFWFAFLSLGGKQHMYYYELHRKYGDFVRVGEFHRLSLQSKVLSEKLILLFLHKVRTSCQLSMQPLCHR